MIEVKEVLYRWCQGMGKKGITRTLGISRNTIREILNQAQGIGLKRESSLSEIDIIASKLQEARNKRPEKPNGVQAKLKSYHAQLEEWWHSPYMTVTQMVRLLSEIGETVSEGSLRNYIKINFQPRQKTTVHLITKPGRQGQVDFGYVGLMLDPVTSKLRKTYAFIMTLSHSRFRFVRFVFRQDVLTWIDCHIRAFQFFKGVPHTILLDNLKSGVNKPDIYDPLINRAYADLERHYGFVVDPAKIRMARHKGKVERSVAIVKQQLIAGRNYSSIDSANIAAMNWCNDIIAHRITRTTGETPWNLFIREEKFELKSLPETDFECPHWQFSMVHLDQHIVYGGSFYSVPQKYVNQTVWIRATEKLVQILFEEQLIKTHPRATRKGQWVTDELDYPEEARNFLRKDAEYCLAKGKEMGPAIYQFLTNILTPPSLTRQRKSQAILRLAENYGIERLEAACQRAINFDNFEYRCLETILNKSLDKILLTESKTSSSKLIQGAFLRNPKEFTICEEIAHES